jgi:hypothetical protein
MQAAPDRFVLDRLGLRLQRTGLVGERRGREFAQPFYFRGRSAAGCAG